MTLTARVGAGFLLCLETCLRSGELLRLRPEAYSQDTRTLFVAAAEIGGRKGSGSGKRTTTARRTVPLTERAYLRSAVDG